MERISSIKSTNFYESLWNTDTIVFAYEAETRGRNHWNLSCSNAERRLCPTTWILLNLFGTWNIRCVLWKMEKFLPHEIFRRERFASWVHQPPRHNKCASHRSSPRDIESFDRARVLQAFPPGTWSGLSLSRPPLTSFKQWRVRTSIHIPTWTFLSSKLRVGQEFVKTN